MVCGAKAPRSIFSSIVVRPARSAITDSADRAGGRPNHVHRHDRASAVAGHGFQPGDPGPGAQLRCQTSCRVFVVGYPVE